MKVLKFGGTSVGSAESILNVKKIVESQTEPVIVDKKINVVQNMISFLR